MNGWQRFFLLILCAFAVMVCYPNYDTLGWSFMGMACLAWTGIIILISIVINLFGLYNFKFLNRLITLVLFCTILYCFLWYFPQTDHVSPINKLKYGEIPTSDDIKKGINRFTFNFDFVNRNVRRAENFVNQDLTKAKAKKEITKTIKKAKKEFEDDIEIIME